eukprot:TRINITY_DN42268_c0_g1_i10.p1 TRINITY_DN42268_c0_g1~~TRINITY_DN42268_c0_g1_i10.p1  ORF type:complete len:457 (-),score=52.72 TRINITY_DN42268_c0_g1_i10:17-1387(-)
MSLARLMDLCSQQLSIEVEYDARELARAITIRPGADISNDELWSLANRVLAAQSLTTIRVPGSEAFIVVTVQRAKELARIDAVESLVDVAGAYPAGYARVHLPVRYRKARAFIEPLEAVLSTSGVVKELVQNESLLVADLRPHVQQAVEMVRGIDVPYETAAVIVEVQHRSAEALTTTVTQIAEKSEIVTGEWRLGELVAQADGKSILIIAPAEEVEWWREQIGRFDRAETTIRQVYSPQHHGVDDVATLLLRAVDDSDNFHVVADSLTGTLIVTGTAEEHSQVAEIVTRLNEAPVSSRRPMRTFVLRNRQADDILGVIDGLVAGGIFDAVTNLATAAEHTAPGDQSESASSDGAARDRPAGMLNEYPGRLPTLSITADAGLNTLIAIGEPLLLERLGSLVAELDVRQPQVEVQVLLLSLTESQQIKLERKQKGEKQKYKQEIIRKQKDKAEEKTD